jgi:hypothetical protein
MDLEALIAQYANQLQQAPQQQRAAYSRAELQAEEIAIAYVQRNEDGSFETLKMNKTSITAVWTTIETETVRNNNQIGSMRLVPLGEWDSNTTPKRKLFADGVPVNPNECLLECLQRRPIENPVLVVRWEPQQRKRTTRTSKELHVEDLSIAYVLHNADGSFETVKMHKTSIKAAWTTIVAETQSSNNTVIDMRMAPANLWERKNIRRRDVFANGVQVQPNQCLRKFLKHANIEDPILLVCWDKPPPSEQCCKRKEWQYYLFTNGTDHTSGEPVVLVHSATGISQLDEEGIQSVASSKFINWITGKTHSDGWEIVSLLGMAASVRVKV